LVNNFRVLGPEIIYGRFDVNFQSQKFIFWINGYGPMVSMGPGFSSEMVLLQMRSK